ncbi:MAG: dTDP-4-dehydrorhamnose 3,5-epimerase [Bacteroidetes bacterium]|nr:MAG: dTDP-4-dehydrorhamnose 3,5-epimerase [Bacteroidota bacterium]
MKIIETGFKGLFAIEPAVFEDNRGYFFESWNKDKFSKAGLNENFLQDNQSLSGANVLRGLHFQLPPWEQGKLVRVITGAVIDVVVDLRKAEPTFGQHFKYKITAAEKNMLWIPPGFAHGFLTLEENTIFFYKCTQVYNRESETSIAWFDPDLNIDWGTTEPLVSEKDKVAPLFRDFKSPF